jgi:hypothetical protein
METKRPRGRPRKNPLPIKIESPVKLFKIKIKIGDQVFEKTATDLLEAFDDFKPEKITNKLTISVEFNGKVFERYMLPLQARRVFGGGDRLALEIFVRNVLIMTS